MQQAMNNGMMANQYVSGSQVQPMNQYNQFPQVGAPGHNTAAQKTNAFWNDISLEISQGKMYQERHHELPMARIKKIMKMDESVQSCMIGSEAPVVISKACEIFIRELTLRAWQHTEDNKRRTLQKIDITAAVNKCDMYDFLIDIIPHEEMQGEYPRSGDIKVVPYEAMYYYYPSVSGSNTIVDNPIPSYPQGQNTVYSQGIPRGIPSSQQSYSRNLSTNPSRPVSTSYPSTLPLSNQQTNDNYMYVGGMQNPPALPNQSLQPNNTMLNQQMMSMYSYPEN